MDSLLALILAVIFGVALYFLDLKKGREFCTWWYNFTHQHPLKGTAEKGLIHLQSTNWKIGVAAAFAILYAVVIFLFGQFHPFIDLLYAGMIFLGMLGGFYLGIPLSKNFAGKVKKIKDVMEKIDEAEVEKQKSKEPEIESEVKEAKPEEKPKKDKPDDEGDWRDGVQEFLDK